MENERIEFVLSDEELEELLGEFAEHSAKLGAGYC